LPRRLKSVVGRSLFGLGLQRVLLDQVAVVVALHRVNDQTAGDALTCGTALFDAYCRFFARHFSVVPLGELVGMLERRAPLRRTLAITFDDGYRDNFECAAPILRSHGLPATFFVATELIGSDTVPWWDRNLSVPAPWMSWQQVQALHRDGFEIGAHTRTHADLGKVEGEEAAREIFGSRDDLERRLGSAPELFAYPYGGSDRISPENRALVREAGFRCCASCFGGVNGAGSDLFALRRVPLSAWFLSPYQFGFEALLHRV
jgi:peptidoglycan/xylan/chitin deacetylase (PgdA/CDA1 family)